MNSMFGEISTDSSGDLLAMLTHDGKSVKFIILKSELAATEGLSLASDVAKDLPNIDAIMKKAAARLLTANYNDVWREYDEEQADGSFKTIVDPKLTQEAFVQKLQLQALHVHEHGQLDFYYENQNLFWGHLVCVTTDNGLKLDVRDATLIG
ncbi:MAG: DUF2262 domain-containing protein [Pirellulaceae bacterium]